MFRFDITTRTEVITIEASTTRGIEAGFDAVVAQGLTGVVRTEMFRSRMFGRGWRLVASETF